MKIGNYDLVGSEPLVDGDDEKQDDFTLPKKIREKIYKTVPPSEYPAEQFFGGLLGDFIMGDERMDSIGELKVLYNLRLDSDERIDELRASAKNPDLSQKQRRSIDDKIFKEQGDWIKSHERIQEISKEYPIHDEDLWRKYLGIEPIDKGSVIESKYQPTRAKTRGGKYYTLGDSKYTTAERRTLEQFVRSRGITQEINEGDFPFQSTVLTGLGDATIDRGVDERGKYFSVYDVYDFDLPLEDLIGNKFEIYDRFYYDE